MKHFVIIVVILAALLALFYAVDKSKKFNEMYRDLSDEQKAKFHWDTKDPTKELTQIFSESFGDTSFDFPRQKVSKVRLFKTSSVFNNTFSERLKTEFIDSLLKFCNNPSNFDWGETTWSPAEAEYILRFFGENNYVVGKLVICLKDCYMVEAKPFTPNMKFGMLSDKGITDLNEILSHPQWWD